MASCSLSSRFRRFSVSISNSFHANGTLTDFWRRDPMFVAKIQLKTWKLGWRHLTYANRLFPSRSGFFWTEFKSCHISFLLWGTRNLQFFLSLVDDERFYLFIYWRFLCARQAEYNHTNVEVKMVDFPCPRVSWQFLTPIRRIPGFG